MKKRIILFPLLLSLFFTYDVSAQRTFLADRDTLFNNSSGIDEIRITKKNIEKIKQLGFVWGFAKYYHPNVAKGDFNFDYQLFRVLRKVIDIDSKTESEEIILKWLKSLGLFS